MARTRASVAAKVAVGKSSKARCSAAPPVAGRAAGSSGDRVGRSYSGGNPACPRPTPAWQKPITHFFVAERSAGSDGEGSPQAGSSKTKPKRNIIHSDDEEEQTEKQTNEQTDQQIVEQTDETDEETEKPVNKELDETIELEPLTGEDSHKIDEYYTNKNKGKGKKTSKDKIDKENIDINVTKNKRHLDELNEDDERESKKIKVD